MFLPLKNIWDGLPVFTQETIYLVHTKMIYCLCNGNGPMGGGGGVSIPNCLLFGVVGGGSTSEQKLDRMGRRRNDHSQRNSQKLIDNDKSLMDRHSAVLK